MKWEEELEESFGRVGFGRGQIHLDFTCSSEEFFFNLFI